MSLKASFHIGDIVTMLGTNILSISESLAENEVLSS